MRVVAVVNQKGGVGKTTTALNLAHALARRGRRIALVDMDPQGNLAASLGHYRPVVGIDRVLCEGDAIEDLLIETRDWCRLLASGPDLARVEQHHAGPDGARQLARVLAAGPPDVDWLVIDCPPSSGMLIVNAIVAADDILIPVAGDYLSLTGLARLMLTLRRLQPLTGSRLRKWIFMSRFVARRRLSQEVYSRISHHFPYSLLTATISEAAALAECAGVGKSIFEYRGSSKSAVEFDGLADALLNKRVVAYEQGGTINVA